MRNERDQYAIRMTAINEGRAEGIAMGKAEGIAMGKAEGKTEGHEEVFALLEQGIPLAEAKKMLGLRA